MINCTVAILGQGLDSVPMCGKPLIDQSIKNCLKWKFIEHRAFRCAGGSVHNIIDPLVQ